MATILQSQSLELVAIMIAINVMIGGFSGDDLKWLAHVTVRLQVSDNSQLSDYNEAGNMSPVIDFSSLREGFLTSNSWTN